jgi:hypothetical protein
MYHVEESSSEATTNGVATNGNIDLSKTTWQDIITCRIEMLIKQ